MINCLLCAAASFDKLNRADIYIFWMRDKNQIRRNSLSNVCLAASVYWIFLFLVEFNVKCFPFTEQIGLFNQQIGTN